MRSTDWLLIIIFLSGSKLQYWADGLTQEDQPENILGDETSDELVKIYLCPIIGQAPVKLHVSQPTLPGA